MQFGDAKELVFGKMPGKIPLVADVTSEMLPNRLCDVMCISIFWPFNIAMGSDNHYMYNMHNIYIYIKFI